MEEKRNLLIYVAGLCKSRKNHVKHDKIKP